MDDWREQYAPEIIGSSATLVEVLAIAKRVARTDCTVLITGESGTGKDLLARAIHRSSGRSSGAFVPLNCGAIPESLLESELFGHVRGAFTGAVTTRTGRFAVADGGTLFLDEIGEMSMNLQAKLLRLLQEKEYSPVGDSRTYKCDVRIIAATNQNLEQKVEDGTFRSDLYWRLNVVQLSLPSLRERRDDVESLANHFLEIYNEKYGQQIAGFAESALEAMKASKWPGNIRQLENVIQRAIIVKGEGSITLDDLPLDLRPNPSCQTVEQGALSLPENGIDLKNTLETLENDLIYQALERTSWNKNKAALLLKLNRTTLVEKLKKKNIKDVVQATAA